MSIRRTILVTGASGFIGRRLVARLVRDGHADVVVLDRGSSRAALQHVETLSVPDTSEPALSSALKGRRFDAVIHLAAAGVVPGERNPDILFRANVAYPANLLRALAETPPQAFVMAGSCAEYAHSEPVAGGLGEDAPVETWRLYGATKAAGTLAASATATALGIPFACLRAFNVYGPGEAPHRLLPNLLKGFASGQSIPLSIGTQLRDFIQVDDVVDALETVAAALPARPECAGIYNLCTGTGTSVADFSRMAARVAGISPDRLDFGAVPLRPDDMMWQIGDNSRLKQAFGWEAGMDLEQGLRRSIEEMQRHNG